MVGWRFTPASFAPREWKERQALRLVDLHMVADNGGFADNDTRCMVDKVFADGCACIDVDTSAAMGVFGHDAGISGTFCVYSSWAMRYTKMAKSPDRKDNLFLALRGWVAIEGGLNVGKQHALDFG